MRRLLRLIEGWNVAIHERYFCLFPGGDCPVRRNFENRA